MDIYLVVLYDDNDQLIEIESDTDRVFLIQAPITTTTTIAPTTTTTTAAPTTTTTTTAVVCNLNYRVDELNFN